LKNSDRRVKLYLPAVDTTRWSAGRKSAVVLAIRDGFLSREDACERYKLSLEELAGWEAAFAEHGSSGLRVTSQQHFRQGCPAKPPRRR
jgi:hypothetical protein